MEYEQFVSSMCDAVNDMTHDAVRVSIHTAKKNNGVTREGLVFHKNDCAIAPTIYLEEYFADYQTLYDAEKDSEDIVLTLAKDVLRYYDGIEKEEPDVSSMFTDFGQIKERIVWKVVNYEKNEDVLQTLPHVRKLDLALVFLILLEEQSKDMFTITVTKEHLSMWNQDEDTLYELARQNVNRLLPSSFRPMNEVLINLMGEENMPDLEPNIMYILTNDRSNLGAGTLFYDRIPEKVGEWIGESYFILPSSIHELIIVPQSKSPQIEELQEMVKEVNETQLMAEEVLSNQVYFYDKEKARLFV